VGSKKRTREGSRRLGVSKRFVDGEQADGDSHGREVKTHGDSDLSNEKIGLWERLIRGKIPSFIYPSTK